MHVCLCVTVTVAVFALFSPGDWFASLVVSSPWGSGHGFRFFLGALYVGVDEVGSVCCRIGQEMQSWFS